MSSACKEFYFLLANTGIFQSLSLTFPPNSLLHWLEAPQQWKREEAKPNSSALFSILGESIQCFIKYDGS
jgi:hypothetical protein